MMTAKQIVSLLSGDSNAVLIGCDAVEAPELLNLRGDCEISRRQSLLDRIRSAPCRACRLHTKRLLDRLVTAAAVGL